MMTTQEITDHALNLQVRLDLERRRVEHGCYAGNREANLDLIRALEGRIAELLAQCAVLEAPLLAAS